MTDFPHLPHLFRTSNRKVRKAAVPFRRRTPLIGVRGAVRCGCKALRRGFRTALFPHLERGSDYHA